VQQLGVQYGTQCFDGVVVRPVVDVHAPAFAIDRPYAAKKITGLSA
jgi:hypothetical protein